MMTPEEFLKPYHRENYSYNCYSENDIIKAMKSYALHVLERVEKESEELSGHVTYPDGSTERYISSYNLKQIFEERKKELKS